MNYLTFPPRSIRKQRSNSRLCVVPFLTQPENMQRVLKIPPGFPPFLSSFHFTRLHPIRFPLTRTPPARGLSFRLIHKTVLPPLYFPPLCFPFLRNEQAWPHLTLPLPSLPAPPLAAFPRKFRVRNCCRKTAVRPLSFRTNRESEVSSSCRLSLTKDLF